MQKIREAISFYGRVQGVGFRYKLGYLAQMYSVTGWARNEYDGSVSTELQGLEEDIDKIIQALYASVCSFQRLYAACVEL